MARVQEEPSSLSLPLNSPDGQVQSIRRQLSTGTPMAQLRETSQRLSEVGSDMLSLEWKDLSFSISGHQILKNCTGLVEPGLLTGVLGPSGSGKTTLLNVLAGRQNTKARNMSLSGQITTSGQPVDPVQFRRNIAYVMQEDALLPFETPRECLSFSAYLRLSRELSDTERREFVDRLLSTLHLEKCASTIVGSQLVKGISGGEKKRTSVGVELITNPKMLFLDEPLSGLDSYAAYTLTEALKQLAEAGVPILCTIHQPSSEIFAMYDDVIILHAGSVAYHGPAKDLATHFESLGFKCPERFNPADHVMFLMQKEPLAKIQEVKASWSSSKICKDITSRVESIQRGSNVGLAITSGNDSQVLKPGFFRQLSVLTAREVRSTLRNKGILMARMGMSTFLAVLYGWLFAGSASKGDDPDFAGPNCLAENFISDQGATCAADFQAHFGTLVSLAISAMMGAAQPILLQFPAERPVFLREYAAGQYGVVPYFISKTLVELPVVFASSFVMFAICYPLMGLHGEFLLLVLVAWTLGIASSSLGLLVGCGVASGQKALQLAPLTLIPQMLFSGLFLPVESIPLSLRWVRFLCPLKYAINLMALVEFKYVKDSIDECQSRYPSTVCKIQHPGDYLRNTLIEKQSILWDKWEFYMAMLVGLLVAFRIISTILLWRKGKYVF
eukprot:TRINITY_DN108733_c0_g1_i1.p1 TRINITY_DN108733_c0_g1~~TRINITY_DN108733_c0_g1_i1.p1  ORF type:complete len:672 (-),score=104.87 TRINITY_DN108733_c0_g1_i1:466-2481(-)